ncbi:MAG: hypothetical protein ACJATU_000447 [Rickettsiales bacterium]
MKSLLGAELSSLCHLVNTLVVEKIINTPATDGIKSQRQPTTPLQGSNDKTR